MNNYSQSICTACGGRELIFKFDLTKANKRENVAGTIVECATCHLWFKIISDRVQFEAAYTGDKDEEKFAQDYYLSETTRAFFRSILSPLLDGTNSQERRLLDIGAGRGALLEEAQKLGFQAEGIDLRLSHVEDGKLRGLKMQHISAENLKAENEFDFITMLDLIEHVTDPLALLKTAHRALMPNGTLVVYTPNHNGAVVILAKFLCLFGIKKPVVEIFGSNHIYFFDSKSLPMLLEKAGFTLEKIELSAYNPKRPGQYVSFLNLVVITLVEWLGLPFGRVFRMLVYARKG